MFNSSPELQPKSAQKKCTRNPLCRVFGLLFLGVSLTLLPVAPAHSAADTQKSSKSAKSSKSSKSKSSKSSKSKSNKKSSKKGKSSSDAKSDTLAQANQPSEEEYAVANQKLLTENAKLQRNLNDLQTQVNVLLNERSGQLFLYGAFSSLLAFVIGVIITWLLLGKRRQW